MREVEMLALGDPEKMLKVAGNDPLALLNVHLYTGDVAAALKQAKRLLLRSSRLDSYYVAQALRAHARCFKAHDLNLVRANAFLQFHADGTGPNPLEDLVAELAGEGKEAAAQ